MYLSNIKMDNIKYYNSNKFKLQLKNQIYLKKKKKKFIYFFI